jgi:hypothetical protein
LRCMVSEVGNMQNLHVEKYASGSIVGQLCLMWPTMPSTEAVGGRCDVTLEGAMAGAAASAPAGV